jgi:hypothetical protein
MTLSRHPLPHNQPHYGRLTMPPDRTPSLPAEQVEVWKGVVGFPGYEVSNMGGVRMMRTRYGRSRDIPRVLKPAKNKSGHRHVNIRRDTKSFSRYVHHLVLEAFVGPRPDGTECCHLNDNKDDNRVDNLRWDTRLANMRDRAENGIINRCAAKITITDVPVIKALVASGLTHREVGKRYGIGKGAVYRICSGRRWASADLELARRAAEKLD